MGITLDSLIVENRESLVDRIVKDAISQIPSYAKAPLRVTIERIEEGSFGECESCGSKIPMERLKVMPFTTVCVPCKSKLEKQRKLFQESNDFTFSKDVNQQEFSKDEEE